MKSTLQYLRRDKLNLPQPSTRTRRRDLDRLTASIAEVGLLVPLIVRPLGDDEYAVIGGEGRLEALEASGAGAGMLVPCFVVEVNDAQAALMALTDNVVREPMTAFDRARLVQVLVGDYGLTQTDVGAAIGETQSAVSRLLAVFTLEPAVVAAVRDEQITMTAATELLVLLGDPEAQLAVLARMLAENLSRPEVASMVARQRFGDDAVPFTRFEVTDRGKVEVGTARNGELVIKIRALSKRGLGKFLEDVSKKIREL